MALMKVKGNLERLFDKNLNDLVRGIRNHKDDEAKYIATCLEEIKQELRQHNTAVKANAVQKLTYLQMQGYDISWAGFNVVEVMASTKFTEKRVGYLAASQSFHQDTEVLMLTTNMIRKDLSSQNTHDAGVALSSLSCFMSTDLARDLTGDILSMLNSTRPYIRKKSVLILYKVFLRYPEALRQAFPRLKEKLEDPDPGVQSAAVNVICELARKNPRNYLSLAPTFFKLMTTSQNNWMLIKIIKLFGALTPLEPRLGKKLIEPLTNLIHSTSAMSLLYECINTVIAVLISISSGMPNHTAAVQLCVQKLRILIEDSDQNLKYLGLLAMSQILKTNPKSVQGHKDLVLQCLDDSDESIRLRALDLLYGMVNKKNLMEIVKKLMVHMDKAEGTTYRDELMDKIIQICSQNDYQHITNFEWYITVLVELTRMEGGTKHGKLIASQMMDVAIRVASIRPFCVGQMALLIENQHMLGTHNSTAFEVLYASSWICGEFAQHLTDPKDTLKAMFKSKNVSSLPGHILSIFLQNAMKLFCYISKNNPEEIEGLAEYLEEKVLKDLMCSADLEVQERASVMHGFVKYATKHCDNPEDFDIYFSGELNPVAPKAQKKVPIPEGLDLDAWINEPPEESEEDEDEDTNDNVFGLGHGSGTPNEHPSTPSHQRKPEPTPEEMQKSRETRLAMQSSSAFYLKGSTKSPLKTSPDVPVQSIDLDIPLKVTGFASSDQYLEVKVSSKKDKKKKKKKKKKEDVEEDDEEEEGQEGPSVLVCTNAEMPEGVESSEGEHEDIDLSDPHQALGAINLDDIEETLVQAAKKPDKIEFFTNGTADNGTKKAAKKEKKEKKAKKEKKEKKAKKEKVKKSEVNGNDEKVTNNIDDLEFWLSPSKQVPSEPVAVKKEKKAKKAKKSKDEKPTKNGLAPPALALKTLASNSSLKISYDTKKVPMDPDKMTAGLSFQNAGSETITALELDFVNTAEVSVINDGPLKIPMQLGVDQLEDHLFLFKVDNDTKKQIIRGTATYTYSSGSQDKLDFKLAFPASKFMNPDPDGLTELLTAGVLEHASSVSLKTSLTFKQIVTKLSKNLNFAVVEQMENSAYFHAKTMKSGHSVAFLIKHDTEHDKLNVDGKSTNPQILASLTDEIRDMNL